MRDLADSQLRKEVTDQDRCSGVWEGSEAQERRRLPRLRVRIPRSRALGTCLAAARGRRLLPAGGSRERGRPLSRALKLLLSPHFAPPPLPPPPPPPQPLSLPRPLPSRACASPVRGGRAGTDHAAPEV
ncbi:PREDICTED: serine/arginine repetitive matrix protein 1-like, partial [Chinchilla lanigera]|uniref:serine/arginine repetitive matrix protein 1-like n=1 Tax=Chinchilla lanigera TaxID=34839 RepID=UPI000698D829